MEALRCSVGAAEPCETGDEFAQCRKRAEGMLMPIAGKKAGREAEKVRPGEAASVQADV
jgi:hypothetical protein